jgi:hypothetical protein
MLSAAELFVDKGVAHPRAAIGESPEASPPRPVVPIGPSIDTPVLIGYNQADLDAGEVQ